MGHVELTEGGVASLWCALVALLTGLGCTGEIGSGGSGTGPDGGSSTSSAGGNGSSSSGTTQGSTTGAGGGATGSTDPEVVTRVARLTHDQYDATVQDLLGITDSPAQAFAPDALNGFDFDTSVDFEVDARLGPQYRTAAESLAERVVSDDAVFARVVPCTSGAAGCSDEFIQSFGQRVFRRPLTATELTGFAALFAEGPELVASGDAFRDGVRLVVEAMLQSPQFLYRTELSDQVGDNGLIQLSSWEVASRLSYFLLGSMPNQDLFDRAGRGELTDAASVVAAVSALLEEPRSLRQLVSFHAQAWDFGRFGTITPDRNAYPNAPTNIVESVRTASERFIEDVVNSGGGLSELLTAPFGYADAGLASLYGISGVSGMARVDFDAGERKGFLMQVGFLASHAYAIDTDPIHRGLFVVRELLCQNIPDPPPGASMTPLPETTEPIETTREEVELLTGQTGCVNCHQQINPPGFAFEGFDAVGQLRTTENQVPVDTSGTLLMDANQVAFSGAVELVDALAASQEARACYASKWLEFAYGRPLGVGDERAVAELAGTPRSVRDTVAQVSVSDAFVNRKPNEVAP